MRLEQAAMEASLIQASWDAICQQARSQWFRTVRCDARFAMLIRDEIAKFINRPAPSDWETLGACQFMALALGAKISAIVNAQLRELLHPCQGILELTADFCGRVELNDRINREVQLLQSRIDLCYRQ